MKRCAFSESIYEFILGPGDSISKDASIGSMQHSESSIAQINTAYLANLVHLSAQSSLVMKECSRHSFVSGVSP